MPASRFTRHLPWLALLAWLAGCVTPPSPPPGMSPAQHAGLLALEHWRVEGKLGIKAPRASESALLDWRQQGEHFDITLSGPLGGARAHLAGTPRQLSLAQPGQPTRHARDADELLSDALGWSVPVEELRYWVRGLASPGTRVQDMQAQGGVLVALRQAGWTLQFSQHREQDGLVLPGRLVMERDGLRLTLIARRWTLN